MIKKKRSWQSVDKEMNPTLRTLRRAKEMGYNFLSEALFYSLTSGKAKSLLSISNALGVARSTFHGYRAKLHDLGINDMGNVNLLEKIPNQNALKRVKWSCPKEWKNYPTWMIEPDPTGDIRGFCK